MSNKVLVYGGRGALGASVVSQFKKNGWYVLSVDLAENTEADDSVLVTETSCLIAQAKQVGEAVAEKLGNDKVAAILCVAGGFAMAKPGQPDYIKTVDLMLKQSVWSSVVASELAAKHLAEGGLLQLTGAAPAVGPTPVMTGYGLSKAAVHQLVGSLAAKNGGLPANSTVAAVVPITLDTPGNRAGMPNADFTSWTTLDYVAGLLFNWTSKASDRPATGSLIKLVTKAGETQLEKL